MTTLPPVSRYIPSPTETTLRNKVCQGAAVATALGGIAFAVTGRSLVSRVVLGGIGTIVSWYIYRFLSDIDGGKSGKPRLMENLSDPRRVDWLLFFGANPNVPARNGNTPLHIATHIDSIRSLIVYGADVNARGGSHETPLYLAVEQKNVAKVRILLDYQADGNLEYVTTGKTQNALDYAKALKKNAESLVTLSPIDAASVTIFEEIIQLLEKHKALSN